MKNIKTFTSWALGESHKKSGKPWQDSVLEFSDNEKELYYCAVSDGHGSNTYFRSHKGSGFLTEITIEAIKQFVNNLDKEVLNQPFSTILAHTTRIKLLKENNPDVRINETIQETAFKQLVSSIISKWNTAIEDDWKNDMPTREFMQEKNVPDTKIDMFLKSEHLEEAYGCTLIATARTSGYWFAFQIGDGKCVAFKEDGSYYEPIPDDERCVGNVTTSMCEVNVIESFRYCYANDNFPPAIFIGSDGMDDAYGDMNLLARLYRSIIKNFINKGFDNTAKELTEDTLPTLSKIGQAQDDMSLAGIIDMDAIKDLLEPFQKIEKEELNKQLEYKKQVIEKRLQALKDKEEIRNKYEKDINSIDEQIIVVNDEYRQENEKQELIKSENEDRKKKVEKLDKEKSLKSIEFESVEKDINRIKETIEKLNTELNGIRTKLGIELSINNALTIMDTSENNTKNNNSEIIEEKQNNLDDTSTEPKSFLDKAKDVVKIVVGIGSKKNDDIKEKLKDKFE